MDGVAKLGWRIIDASEQRLESVAQNIANTGTFGYKSERSFEAMTAESIIMSNSGGEYISSIDMADGSLVETGNPLDLALSGGGFFVVRRGEDLYLTRNGQFSRGDEGQLVLPGGATAQLAGGGDAVIGTGLVTILPDATITVDAVPVGRLAVVDLETVDGLDRHDNGLFAMPSEEAEQMPDPVVRQAMLEASNVSLGEEMVAMMEAMRRAETGQRVIQTYDQLMGRVLQAFGGAGR
ncbi:MAG: flagellar hook-basal body protein [Pseudomonadota bacterium]